MGREDAWKWESSWVLRVSGRFRPSSSQKVSLLTVGESVKQWEYQSRQDRSHIWKDATAGVELFDECGIDGNSWGDCV